MARLDIAGFCHQKPGEEDPGDVLHVLGRTRGTPARYFYRQRVDGWRWTPWEKVDLDIEGDQLLPVVHQRRLYLFWAQITEAALEERGALSASGGAHTASEPVRYFRIRLAWAERRGGRWSSKRVSRAQLGATEADFRRLERGLVKTAGTSSGDFFLRVHEADGDLLVEPIRRLRSDAEGSGGYVRLDRFRLSGCDGTVSLEPASDAEPLTVRTPGGAHTEGQRFVHPGPGGALTLPVRNPVTGSLEREPTLGRTPSRFEVVPDRVPGFEGDEVFFFQDLRRTFFVEPHDAYRRLRPPMAWAQPDGIPLDVTRLLPGLWPSRPGPAPRPMPPGPDPWRYDPGATVTDPAPLVLSPWAALVPKGPGGPAELLALGATRIGETFGPRVAFLGASEVEPNPAKLAVRSVAHIVGDGRGELLSLRSADAPPDVGGLRVLTTEETYWLPGEPFGAIVPGIVLGAWDGRRFRFGTFYHPHLCVMMEQLRRFGLDGLLDPSPSGPAPALRRQGLTRHFFERLYQPLAVERPYPKDDFDFSPGGAYALYNWEIFFHVPFLVACHLSRNQRFEEAQRWFHYVFDPTDADPEPAPRRFWKVRPFFELFHGEDAEAGPIQDLLLLLGDDGSDPASQAAREALIAQVAAWRRNPFDPHAIARLRPTAYQKAVFMRYVDNLIAWGDRLFRRDTMESLGEALQLYVLAAQLLGRRPRRVQVEPPAPRTFDELLAAGLDEFGNTLVEEVEGFLPDVGDRGGDEGGHDLPILGPTLFFCVPPNEQLVARYWDRVADRLFKLRHCMNIEGVVRQLPLFEPPVDPGLLVRASTAGVDLASALGEPATPLPRQRFRFLAAKAIELCADVRALGQALLGALEKRDAEALALLRAGHEHRLRTAMVAVREQQIEEARAALEGLRRSREQAEVRRRYYERRRFTNDAEHLQLVLLSAAGVLDLAAGLVHLGGASAAAVPNFTVGSAGFGGTPLVTTTYGGGHGGSVAQAVAQGLQVGARALDRAGQLAGILGSYHRRADDWALQAALARKDIEALDEQILAAEVRVAVADKELENLRLQIEQAEQTEAFLRDKYTDTQLYQWMADQLSSLYFQSYQLAYDLAKRAERAWQFELAEPDRSFVQFGHWDGLRKGLLAGERLHHDIRRMEVAYLDARQRDYELTRHVSLRQLDPLALLHLRRDGECLVRIPEAWFDLDSPGHYLRRIKTVALSIPAVAGPYVPVRCTLTLLRSSVRVSPSLTPGYGRTSADDPRFRDDPVGLQSIVTSRAEEDGGLFETNLGDERYLPFEGSGVDSEWRLELPRRFRQFDYDTIGDVVLHIRYTARDGGASLRAAAEAHLLEALRTTVLGSQASRPAAEAEGLLLVASARRDFPEQWARFLSPPEDRADQTMTFDLGAHRFPFVVHDTTLEVLGFEVLLVVRDPAAYAGEPPVKLRIAAPGGGEPPAVELHGVEGAFGGLPHGRHGYGGASRDPGDWVVTFRAADNAGAAPSVVRRVDGRPRLDRSAVEDLVLVLRYRAVA